MHRAPTRPARDAARRAAPFAAAVTDPELARRVEASGNDPVSQGPEGAEALSQRER
jgi:hypothetical protein